LNELVEETLKKEEPLDDEAVVALEEAVKGEPVALLFKGEEEEEDAEQ